MEVSFNWLREYLQLNISPKQLADKISRMGVEVTNIHSLRGNLSKLIVGYIVSIKHHPKNKHLFICYVDVGLKKLVQIVCGASNVAENQYVIVALPGSIIFENKEIKLEKIDGEISEGMICSLKDLGFNSKIIPNYFMNGIFIFPNKVEIGKEIFSYLDMDDQILSLEVTPNRADILGMHGVAWEVGAICNKKPEFGHVKFNKEKIINKKTGDFVKVNILNKDIANSYQVRIVTDVTVKQSPLWMQKRLWNSGIQPINNIIDSANYIMLTYGLPIGVYDYDKIKNHKLNIRYAKNKIDYIKINGIKHGLNSNDIIISDDDNVIALAGIANDDAFLVDNKTKTIVLETASFNPLNIRKTAQRCNIHTESSYRYERGVNVMDVDESLNAVCATIAYLGNGRISDDILSVSKINPLPTVLDISLDRINKVLGLKLSEIEVRDIFKRLGFHVENNDGLFLVSIPPRRWDISIEADLIEEIGRLYGYDKLPSTLPHTIMTPGFLNPYQKFIKNIRNIMESSGLDQSISYSLTNENKASQFVQKKTYPTKVNLPMTKDHCYLRENLISGLLNNIAYNISHKQLNLGLYEEGKVFLKDSELQIRPNEIEYLAGAITGLAHARNWNINKRNVDFYDLKGVLDFLFSNCNFQGNVYYYPTSKYNDMHPGRTADIYVNNIFVGFIGQVHPFIAESYHINSDVYVFQLNIDKLFSLPKNNIIYHEISKFPKIERDISILVNKDINNYDVEEIIKNNGGKFLQKIQLFDVYQNKDISNINKKSLAYKLTFLNHNHTLTEQEINDAMHSICKYLKLELNADIR